MNDPDTGEAFTNMFRKVRSIFSLPQAPKFKSAWSRMRARTFCCRRCSGPCSGSPLQSGGLRAAWPNEPSTSCWREWRRRKPRWRFPIWRLLQEEASGSDFLRAATELINAEGYRGASVSKIASRLNVTKGSFYHHLETKDELVEECFERTWDILRQGQLAADRGTSTGLANLLAQAQAMVAGQVTEERLAAANIGSCCSPRRNAPTAPCGV